MQLNVITCDIQVYESKVFICKSAKCGEFKLHFVNLHNKGKRGANLLL